MSALLDEILRDAAVLIRQSANGKRGTIALCPETAAALDRIQSRESRTSPGNAAPALVEVSELRASSSQTDGLIALATEIAACRKCGLCEGRTQTVFADGNPNADVVFVGEAPGEQEDLRGLPFVGAAGQLLTDIIVKGMKMKRSDVYICNVIKCRPPLNRDPSLEEKAACEPFLIRQLELVKPKVICTLGKHAANTLLRTDLTMGRLRNKWHFYRGIPMRATFHPAYLLRTPSDKAKTWADIQEVMKVLSGEMTPAPDDAESFA